MKKCPKCNITFPHSDPEFCHYCKTKVMEIEISPEVIKHRTSPIDFSRDGLNYLQNYIDTTISNLTTLMKALGSIQQHKRKMPIVFGKNKWIESAKMLNKVFFELGFNLTINISEDRIEELRAYPPGCYHIWEKVNELKSLTGIFYLNYEDYLNRGMELSLSTAGERMEQIVETHNMVLTEIEKVFREIKNMNKQ